MLEHLIAKYPWPDQPPAVLHDLGPAWFRDDDATGHTAPLKNLVGPETRVLLELGSFAGRSTTAFLRICPNAHVIAVDTWLGSPEYHSIPEALALLPRLYETFQANLWPHRSRLTAIRATTIEGMQIVHDHGVVPDAVYVDADHGTESVLADLACARRLFPQAQIIGDDWLWPTVQAAVEQKASEWGLSIAYSGNVWWLLPETSSAHHISTAPMVAPAAQSPHQDRNPSFDEGWQLHQAGQRRQAEQVYRRLLQADHHAARVWFVLGHLLMDDRRIQEAVVHFRQALELAPGEPEGHFQLGNALLQLNRWAEAEPAYRKCLDLKGDHLEALVNLGCALGELERHAEAEACYRRALALKPDVAEIHHNLANALRDQGRPDESLAGYHKALELRPDYAKAEINLGVALVTLGQVDEAVARLRRGVSLDPEFAEAHSSLGAALSAQGRIDEALAAYDTAIRLKPDYPDAHWNRSLNWLLLGDFQRGWQEYEWRWRCKRTGPAPNFSQPRWDGSPLNGRAILLCSEQGLGDTLQFVRYAPLVQALGGRVVLRCQRSLVPILASLAGLPAANVGTLTSSATETTVGTLTSSATEANAGTLASSATEATVGTLTSSATETNVGTLTSSATGVSAGSGIRENFEMSGSGIRENSGGKIEQLIADGDPLPEFDCFAPLMSLPAILGTTLETVPANVPYLVADPERVDHWRDVLSTIDGFRVGIVWQGSIRHPWDRHRSCKLANFEPLGHIRSVRLISLQKGPGIEQLQELGGDFGFTVAYLGGSVDESGAFLDTAAIMANLDLVVTVDTASAHLAGALGVPCWLALAHTPDYRWLLGRDGSPWYPSMRLFRQPAVGDWSGVFLRMADELDERL